MILFARNRLRALIVLIFAHDMQIQVAHALCKQGCRLISYTADIRLVTIATCYNCPRSPLQRFRIAGSDEITLNTSWLPGFARVPSVLPSLPPYLGPSDPAFLSPSLRPLAHSLPPSLFGWNLPTVKRGGGFAN